MSDTNTDTNTDTREYDPIFSNALNAVTILNDTLGMIKMDINFLGKKYGDCHYGKTTLQSDFEKLAKAHTKQTEYMLELSKELQKTYKMY